LQLAVDSSNISSLAESGTASSATNTRLSRTRINQEAIKRWAEMDKGSRGKTQTVVPSDSSSSTTVAGNAPPTDLGVIKLPESPRVVPREEKLQEWEGQVQEVREKYFSARLVDLTRSEKEETEESDLPIDDLVEGDRALLMPGALFRWIIGYRWEDGEKERFTRVVIRRLPIWTEQEIKSADSEAAELYNALFGDESRWAASARSD
jgi:hypothetical protein